MAAETGRRIAQKRQLTKEETTETHSPKCTRRAIVNPLKPFEPAAARYQFR
jgi:hypothetical protein